MFKTTVILSVSEGSHTFFTGYSIDDMRFFSEPQNDSFFMVFLLQLFSCILTAFVL